MKPTWITGALLLGLAPSLAAAVPPINLSRTDFNTATNSWAVTAGDLNGDGRADLAVANYGSNTVSILLGTGGGSFSAPSNYTTGLNPVSVAIGDLNSDNVPDLVLCNWSGASFSVLLGTGGGSFAPHTEIPTGASRPIAGRLIDLNNDYSLDLVYALRNSGLIEVRLGNGVGGFGAPTTFPTGGVSFPYAIAIMDVNADGRADLAVGSDTGSAVSILLGTGGGSFGAATSFTTGTNPAAVALGDLNGDGNPDLAAVSQNSGTVSVLLGSGTGNFGPKTDYVVGTGPISVAIRDLNLDGPLDVVVSNSGASTISVLRGNGTGALLPTVDFATGAGPRLLTVADLDADGNADIAVADFVGNAVSVFLNDSVGLDHFCPGSVVANGDFTDGIIPGSMPGGAVDDWSVLTETPQVITDGCDSPGALQMWGNQAVGESVFQQLPGTGFQAGKTYRVTICYRWLDNNPSLPSYVRFRLAATNAAPGGYPATSGYSVVGITPNTTSTTWVTYTFPDWTPSSNAAFLTINPENDFNLNDGNFVSWGQIDDICVREVECGGVSNGDFTDGLVPGSMPSGAVDDWYVLTATPQVVTDGCAAPGALQMWGNLAVGESVKQLLPGTGFQAGKTYRVTVCYRWLDNNPDLPQYVRFRLAATGSNPSGYPATSGYDVIGSTPNTASTTWQSYTFPDWTAPTNGSWITINAENDLAVNDGNFVSWGQIDDICVEEAPCGVAANGDFTDGLIPGSMPDGAVDDWSVLSASPQVVTDGCAAPGAVQMWGNQAVGESIKQLLPGSGFVSGRTYRVTVCYRWLDNNNPTLPPYVGFRLAASAGLPTAYPPVAGSAVIGITPYTSSTSWISYTFADWTPTSNAPWLTVNPENLSAVNDGAFVSWGQIDDICVEDVTEPDVSHVGPGSDPGIAPNTAGNLRLLWAGPSPSHGEMSINFATGARAEVELLILDASGARVHAERTPFLTGGYHQLLWDGKAPDGTGLPAGVYYFRLKAGADALTGKLVRVR